MIEFQAFPKIPRLNREMVVTEKIDGTNAAVRIVPLSEMDIVFTEDGGVRLHALDRPNVTAIVGDLAVFAQSRKRFIQPGNDNFGFASWVHDNAEDLVVALGEGTHYGEWWGSKIQRGYGLTEKRFSLFNTHRWEGVSMSVLGLGVVPVLYRGTFDSAVIEDVVRSLRENGSVAAPGYMNPEGVVVYQRASGQSFKVMCHNDDVAKGEAA